MGKRKLENSSNGKEHLVGVSSFALSQKAQALSRMDVNFDSENVDILKVSNDPPLIDIPVTDSFVSFAFLGEVTSISVEVAVKHIDEITTASCSSVNTGAMNSLYRSCFSLDNVVAEHGLNTLLNLLRKKATNWILSVDLIHEALELFAVNSIFFVSGVADGFFEEWDKSKERFEYRSFNERVHVKLVSARSLRGLARLMEIISAFFNTYRTRLLSDRLPVDSTDMEVNVRKRDFVRILRCLFLLSCDINIRGEIENSVCDAILRVYQCCMVIDSQESTSEYYSKDSDRFFEADVGNGVSICALLADMAYCLVENDKVLNEYHLYRLCHATRATQDNIFISFVCDITLCKRFRSKVFTPIERGGTDDEVVLGKVKWNRKDLTAPLRITNIISKLCKLNMTIVTEYCNWVCDLLCIIHTYIGSDVSQWGAEDCSELVDSVKYFEAKFTKLCYNKKVNECFDSIIKNPWLIAKMETK